MSNKTLEEITGELSNAKDFTDSEGRKWRCSLPEMRIKQQTAGRYGHGWSLFHKYTDVLEMARDWAKLMEGDPDSMMPEDVPEESLQAITERMQKQVAYMAVEVLPPEKSLPATVTGYTPEQVTVQYKRAVAGTIEVFRFGAMLMDIDTVLTRENSAKARNSSKGDVPSLKSWLEEHCPEISYKSAIRFKGYAEDLQEHFKLPKSMPVSLALPCSDGTISVQLPDGCKISQAKVEKIQVEVWETCEGNSMRQVLFGFMKESKERGGDKKSGNDLPKLTEEQKYQKRIDDAIAVFKAGIDQLNEYIGKEYHLLLPANSIKTNLTKLSALQTALKEALKNQEK